MTWGGAAHFLLIALVTLPIAGIPLAIWIAWQYRRDYRRAYEREINRRLQVRSAR